MRFSFCVLIFLLDSRADGFAFQRINRQRCALFALHDSKPHPQHETPHLYIPDDEDVLVNGRQKKNVVSESRTVEGAKIYLPDGDDMNANTQQYQQTTKPRHVYAGIDEELLVQESEFVAFNGMNSNTHVQIDRTTFGQPTTTAGKPMVLKHLYRYFTDICVDCWLSTVEPFDFLLSCNYTKSDIAEMEKAFPRFTSLDVKSHLSPHARFIVRTLGAGTGDICDGQECSIDGKGFIPHNLQVSELGKSRVPPIFFGKR